jgi:hypothetical protein
VITYTVEEAEPDLVVPKSDDDVILVLDLDNDEIRRPGEVNEIVREP